MAKSITGITIKKSKVSQAFSIISFMVAELFFDGTIQCPVNPNDFEGLDSDHFHSLRDKIMHDLHQEGSVTLNVEESVLLYLLVDIVCKCFVGEANITLREQAKITMEIGADEYKQVRLSYLHYAQSLLEEMNSKFSKLSSFNEVKDKLQHWKS